MPHGRVEAFPDIAQLPDLEVGAQDDKLAHVHEFLVRFGYLAEGSFIEGTLDEATSQALSVFQRRNALVRTGVLDADTRDAMTTARCGIPDSSAAGFSTRCAWNRMTLSFAFGPGTPDTGGAAEFGAVRRAFATWAAARPFVFSEVTPQDDPDILIDWRNANDPDLSMVGGILAHADFPPECGVVTDTLPKPVHFDDSEHRWAIGAVPGDFDVETVALHEIGHILGLEHSDVNGAVMFPSVSSNFTLRALQPDDRAGIEELYPEPPAAPDEPGGPAVTADGPHVLDVFVRGKHNHELVHRFFDGGKWSGWINLGGDLAAGPAVTAKGPHVLDVFVRGKHNDELVHRFWNGTKWSGWINLGGDLD